MTSLNMLYEGLSQSPNDWQARQILADWFEEAGRQAEADCVRWMVRQRKRPYRATAGSFHWFNAVRAPAGPRDAPSDLPETVCHLLRGPEGLADVFRDYPTLRQADEDLFQAWQEATRTGRIDG